LSTKESLNTLFSFNLTIWQDFEKFADYFEVFKLNIISNFKKNIFIKDYFQGAYFSSDTEKINLDLSKEFEKYDYIISKNQFPEPKNFIVNINNIYKWNNENFIFKNSSSKNWADSWKSFKNNITILYQQKTEELNTDRKTLSFNDIIAEKIKNENLNKKINKIKNPKKLSNINEFKNNKFITCLLTTKPLSNECKEGILQTDNLIVISRESFSKYYGEAFILKLKYCNFIN
jgi:hypothetical protein